jgi:hypothetical protein
MVDQAKENLIRSKIPREEKIFQRQKVSQGQDTINAWGI